MKLKNRFWFYFILIFLHVIWFSKTGIIPSRVDALILMTIYFLMFCDSFTIDYANKDKTQRGKNDN